jgi:hypothetical protein
MRLNLYAAVVASCSATGVKAPDRFANIELFESMSRSRSDAAEAAAQVPGAAGVLLEALRWRGRTAQQIGLPSKLWCADFMNFVLRRAGSKGTQSHVARLFLQCDARPNGRRASEPAPMGRTFWACCASG